VANDAAMQNDPVQAQLESLEHSHDVVNAEHEYWRQTRLVVSQAHWVSISQFALERLEQLERTQRPSLHMQPARL